MDCMARAVFGGMDGFSRSCGKSFRSNRRCNLSRAFESGKQSRFQHEIIKSRGIDRQTRRQQRCLTDVVSSLKLRQALNVCPSLCR